MGNYYVRSCISMMLFRTYLRKSIFYLFGSLLVILKRSGPPDPPGSKLNIRPLTVIEVTVKKCLGNSFCQEKL